jgi:signal transduction histidine kinase
MDRQSDVIEKSELRFFSEVSAANAHEIKNALAVINENAGLLDDLVTMAHQGVSLDLSRLKRVAAVIKKQVARADHIAKSTSRFSHCVEMQQTATDLEQALVLVIDLASRYATLRDVQLRILKSPKIIFVSARPFALLHLLWICLYESIKTCRKGQELTVTVKKADATVEIHYGPLAAKRNALLDKLHAESEIMALLHSTSGAVSLDLDSAALKLTLTQITNSLEPREV